MWAAWHIARPLRRLRTEVLEIAGGNLDTRVSVKGSEEITQVAEAVNSMAQNLSQNITGMRELVANISHEMRSPLARMTFSSTIIEEGLQGLTHWFKKQPPSESGETMPVIMDSCGSPLAIRHIARLTQEIEHMESLVGSCLLSSKLDLQQEKPMMTPLDISGLCKKIIIKYEPLLQEKDISFNYEIQENIWLNGDESLLSLVLTNLLDNALKYTHQGGLVRMRLNEEKDSAILLHLENSHAPIDEAFLSRLFEPFFRGMDTAGDIGGVGLGLSLVRKIIACHQGGITVENGEFGLLFTVSLPGRQYPGQKFVRWFFERHGELGASQS